MTLACGGRFAKDVEDDEAILEDPPLKANQFRGNLHRTNGDTGEITLLVNGMEKKYMLTKDCLIYSMPADRKPSQDISDLILRDVIVTLEKKDGKELVAEIRGTALSTKLTKKGTRVEGKRGGRDRRAGK
jgi:hypothetical protein